MPIPVLYFHGFASSPASSKVIALRELLAPDIELVVPDMNVPSFEKLDWPGIVALGVSTGRACNPRAVVGSSLGSIIALSVVREGIHAPMVVIAPALGLRPRWKERLDETDDDPIITFNYARNENAPLHRKFFEQLCAVDVDRKPPPVRITAIMGRNDQTVPFEVVEETWRAWETSGHLVTGSKLIPIDDGDHSLLAQAELIGREIRAAAMR